MRVSEISDVAENFLDFHRKNLLIDPFFKITLELIDGDFISKCESDVAPLSWKIKLNPSRHHGMADIQYSVVESLLFVLFDGIERDDKVAAIIARLTTSICGLFSGDEDSDDE